jgi:hypothetical protein
VRAKSKSSRVRGWEPTIATVGFISAPIPEGHS